MEEGPGPGGLQLPATGKELRNLLPDLESTNQILNGNIAPVAVTPVCEW